MKETESVWLLFIVDFFMSVGSGKESFVFSRVYRRILLSKSSFKRLIFTLLKQLNTDLQAISIPPHSCLQWHLQPVTSTHIFLPRAIKYHKVREYSRGKLPTISMFLITFRANLSASLPSSWSAWGFYLLWVFKQLYRRGIPEQLSWKEICPSSVPDSSPHLKLGY